MSDANIDENQLQPINGYTLTAKLRRVRRGIYLSATEQALFHELICICNENGWPTMFKVSNAELYNALNVTEKTLIGARDKLIEAGLIWFISGKSKRQFSTYSLQTTVMVTANQTANKVANAEITVEPTVIVTANKGGKTSDYSKQKRNENSININIEFKKSLLAYGFASDLVDEWMQIRKVKKAVNTETAFKKFIAEVEKSGRPPDEVLRMVVEKQWKGFESSWLESNSKNYGNASQQIRGNELQFEPRF